MTAANVYCVFIVLVLDITVREAAGKECQQRHELVPTARTCRKTCDADNDCTSRKKSCQCDGICGRSCIKHNQRCTAMGRTVEHGTVTIVPVNQFGAVAQYRCDEGYTLKGREARVCQGDGTWSGGVPTCYLDTSIVEPMECSAPPQVHHAEHNGAPAQPTYALGTMLEYRCDRDYAMSRDGVTRAWCVGGGLWVGPNMTCTHAGCPVLPDIEHGWVVVKPPSNVGNKATYYCKHGFHLAGRDERVCGPNGRWGGFPPSCEKVTCGPPPLVEHASHDGPPDHATYPSGKQLLYSCSYGYYRDGTNRAMCSGEGTWVGLNLMCSPRNCGFPGDIENGWRTGYVFTYPNKVNYFCHDGFELQGSGYRTCQASGLWSDEVPICEPVNCPTLLAPVYGKIIGAKEAYGTVVRFECEDGYKVIGSAERRCQADRTWSGQPARCEEIDCGWPGPFWNGYLIGVKTTVGAIIFFSCNTRTTFQGPSFQTTCLENGDWSEPPPKCWGQCQVPAVPNATLQGGRELVYVNHGTIIEFRCVQGLVPRNGANIQCNNGTWSSDPECVPAACPSAPPHVSNGMRIFLGQKHGNRARYKCFSGYRLTGMNTTYLACNYGRWTGGRPHCEEFFCPSPRKLSHGEVYKKVNDGRFIFQPYIFSIRHGIRLEYECDDGYRIVGPGGATCVNGQWQPPLSNPGTKCEPAIHPPFPKLWTPIPANYG